jgi:hypothetical protein
MRPDHFFLPLRTTDLTRPQVPGGGPLGNVHAERVFKPQQRMDAVVGMASLSYEEYCARGATSLSRVVSGIPHTSIGRSGEN